MRTALSPESTTRVRTNPKPNAKAALVETNPQTVPRWDESSKLSHASLFRGDHSLADRIEDQVRQAVEVELLENVLPVANHCSRAEVEQVRDVLVAFALG